MSINVIKRVNVKMIEPTNKEKYADDIINVARFGVVNGEIVDCMEGTLARCDACEFKNSHCCKEARKNWLNKKAANSWLNAKKDDLIKICVDGDEMIYHMHSYDSKHKLVALYSGGRDSHTTFGEKDFFVVPEEICERIKL